MSLMYSVRGVIKMNIKENELFVPCVAFLTTIIMMQAPWFGLFASIPFIITTKNYMQS
jgi:hypothetical protein